MRKRGKEVLVKWEGYYDATWENLITAFMGELLEYSPFEFKCMRVHVEPGVHVQGNDKLHLLSPCKHV